MLPARHFWTVRQVRAGSHPDKNNRAILFPDICPLAIERCRVMEFPEKIENFSIRYDSEIENHFNCFGVSGGTLAYFFICRMRCGAAAVSGCDREHARNTLEQRFKAPEAPARKEGFFGFLSCFHSCNSFFMFRCDDFLLCDNYIVKVAKLCE